MTSTNMELPPIRNLNDFILESARFQLPNFQDFEKWGNRVVKNLLYYQTNYFIIGAIFFAVMGIIHPIKIISGIISIASILFVAMKVLTKTKNDNNDWIILGGVAAVGLLLMYILEAILIVAFTFLVPFCAAFVHSSLRLRNMKNKMVNVMENLGLKNTPMGWFLDLMSVNPDIISNIKGN